MKVSISKIKLFKACRRAYELKYIHNLVPVVKSDSLVCGSNYHALLEGLYTNGILDVTEPSKELAMAMAYAKYIYPKFEVEKAEEWFEFPIGDDILCGRIDAIAKNGNIVEHKTTSSTNLAEYEYSLMWDEQLLAYMLVTGARKVYYTICRKPNIKQKTNETDDEFFERMVAWYDEDTDEKIRLVELTRTDDEVEDFKQSLCEILPAIKEGRIYRNTCHCSQYGRRCEYSGICLEKELAENYVEYERREEYADNQN